MPDRKPGIRTGAILFLLSSRQRSFSAGNEQDETRCPERTGPYVAHTKSNASCRSAGNRGPRYVPRRRDGSRFSCGKAGKSAWNAGMVQLPRRRPRSAERSRGSRSRGPDRQPSPARGAVSEQSIDDLRRPRPKHHCPDAELHGQGVESEEAKAALYSTVHGAGRLFGRKQAIRTFTKPQMDGWLQERGVMLSGGGIDESPMAYRRLPEVLAYRAASLKVLHTLRPFAVAMAGEAEFDPWKD